MAEAMANQVDSRHFLIREAYIDPIRTAIVVDDDFPTLDGLLASLGDAVAEAAMKERDVERAKQVLAFCRGRKWVVDIHDGRNIDEADVAPHLHQCDLLILDYLLQGDHGEPTKSLNIIRHLANNDHFNLVVVYTKESTTDTFRTIALSLLGPWEYLGAWRGKQLRGIEGRMEEWEDSQGGVQARILSCVTDSGYLALRTCRDGVWPEDVADWHPEAVRIKAIWEGRPEGFKVNLDNVLKWALARHERRIIADGYFGDSSVAGPLRCEAPTDGDPLNWLRTPRLFLTVINKGTDAAQIPVLLEEALRRWAPNPHRLVMAKMRALLDEKAGFAEDGALSDRYLQAGWFHDLVESSDVARSSAISSALNRHWEGLLATIVDEVAVYAGTVIEGERKNSESAIDCVRRSFGVDFSNSIEKRNARLRQNAYYCSLPPSGWHITTGHILNIEGELWVCLTPACDLVPGQKDGRGWNKNLSGHMPFTAVRLHQFQDANIESALEQATGNLCVFLNIDGEVKAYKFISHEREDANPSWELMFAARSGELEREGRKLRIKRLKFAADGAFQGEGYVEGTVCAQLRYEYAINLMQRFGIHLSRVGLDFLKI